MIKLFTKKRKGFTLIELIVVIAILGILAAIALPRLGGFRENANISADETFAKSIASAVEMYNAANNVTLAEGAVSAYDDELGDMVDNDKGFVSKKYNVTGAAPTLAYNAAGQAIVTNGKGTTVWEPK